MRPDRGCLWLLLVSGLLAPVPAVGSSFDCDAYADLVVGVPWEDNGSGNEGAVNLLRGSYNGPTATGDLLLYPGMIGIHDDVEGAHFGGAIAGGDFDGDGCDDLIVATPEASEEGGSDGIYILPGTASGPSVADAEFYAETYLESGVVDYDTFPWALIAGDFDGDGVDDLAMGSSTATEGSDEGSGAVMVLYGEDGDGLDLGSVEEWTQSSDGISGSPEDDDAFGQALAAGDFDGDGRDDLAIGAPGENSDAGVVHVVFGTGGGLDGSGSQLLDQSSAGTTSPPEAGDWFGGTLESGDFNGDGDDDLAVAAVREDNSSGMVTVFYGSGSGLDGYSVWTQGKAGLLGSTEAGDLFGAALAAGDFDNDGYDDLAVGAPWESYFTTYYYAGAVTVLYGADWGLSTSDDQWFTQDTPGIEGNQSGLDVFGASLTTGDYNADGFADLAVGAPGEMWYAVWDGAVHVIFGSGGVGLTATGDQIWSQDSPNVDGTAEDEDGFGDVLF